MIEVLTHWSAAPDWCKAVVILKIALDVIFFVLATYFLIKEVSKYFKEK